MRNHIAAAGLVAGALLLAACGGGSEGPGVAGADGSTTAAKPASAKKSELAYSKCMRAHGVKDFPDPNANGQIELKAGPGSDLAPDSPIYKAADKACKSLMPGPGTPEQQRKDYAAALKFAKCMRAHGVKDLPDPQPPGSGPQTQSRRGAGGNGPQIDPESPVFKAAQQACQSLQPGGAALSTHSENGGS